MQQSAIMFPELIDPKALDAGDASDGWYTPPKYIALAREMLGEIDLDPASCSAAQAVVRAIQFYTEHEDGLKQPWSGRMWLNPPYSAPTPWVRRAIAEYREGHIQAALILTNSYTETGWWQDLAAEATMLTFRGRLNFWHPEKTTTQNRTGQTMAYLGSDISRFVEVFGHLGLILRRV
jgi:ParB family chromosome partitioning protein